MLSTCSIDLVILVPALNEEADIEKTIRELLPILRRTGNPFEIVAVNDGSTDQTGAIIDRLAAEIPEVRAVHHESPRGGGACFAEVLWATRARYITVIPGDNAFDSASLQSVFASVGQTDLIISYRTNQKERASRRSFFSRLMRRILNIMFGLNLADYHSVVIYPATKLKELHLKSEGYSYQMEALVSLIKRGCDTKQVPVVLNLEIPGRSRAFNFRIMRQLALTAMKLFFRYQLRLAENRHPRAPSK